MRFSGSKKEPDKYSCKSYLARRRYIPFRHILSDEAVAGFLVLR